MELSGGRLAFPGVRTRREGLVLDLQKKVRELTVKGVGSAQSREVRRTERMSAVGGVEVT